MHPRKLGVFVPLQLEPEVQENCGYQQLALSKVSLQISHAHETDGPGPGWIVIGGGCGSAIVCAVVNWLCANHLFRRLCI